MRVFKSLSEVTPTPILLANKVAAGLMGKVVMGIVAPWGRGGIKDVQSLAFTAMRAGRGEQFVRNDPLFKAAVWLLS